MAAASHHRLAHLVVYFLTFALAIISAAAGIHALVKSHNEKTTLTKLAASLGVTVDIDISNLRSAGIVLTVALFLLALFAAVGLLSTFVSTLLAAVLPYQFTFVTVWIFANSVAVTYLSRNRTAQISAVFTANGEPVPDSIIVESEQELHYTPVYWQNSYVKFFAIVIWFAFAFSVLSTVIAFLVSRHTTPAPTGQKGAEESVPEEKTEEVRKEETTA